MLTYHILLLEELAFLEVGVEVFVFISDLDVYFDQIWKLVLEKMYDSGNCFDCNTFNQKTFTPFLLK